MDKKTFLENFGKIADAPNGIQQLRKTVLNLAIAGALSSQEAGDGEVFEQLLAVPENEIGEPLVFDSSSRANYRANWVRASFRNIGRWVGGNGFPTAEQGNSLEEILFCKVSDMNREGNEIHILSTAHTISEETAKRLRVTVHSKGTVVFPKIGGAIATNKRRIIVTPTAIDNNCMGVAPCSAIDSDWLYILLLSYDFVLYQTGTALPSLSQRILDQIEFGVPPLAEQKRIVAKVDELMALCDELEAEKAKRETLRTAARASAIDAISTASTPEELSTAWSRISNNWEVMANDHQGIGALRDLIRKIALEGWLSSSVHSDESVTSLISRIAGKREDLSLVHSDPASDVDSLIIPEHWADVNFGFVHRFTNGFTFPSNAYQESGTGIVRITEIKQHLISTQAMKFVDSKYFTDLDSKFQVKPGDLVIAMSGATTGGIAFNRTDETFLLNQRVGKIEPILIIPEFVAMFLVSMKDRFLTNAAGSAIPNLSTKQIQEARFALPPVEEQERIVAKVQELMRLCDHLEMNLNMRTEIESAFANSSSQLLSV